MIEMIEDSLSLFGPKGSIPVNKDDKITLKLSMLFEGQCEGLGPSKAAKKFGYSRQRYYQILKQFLEKGALGLMDFKTGPKGNYRRTDEVTRQVIRYKFLDPKLSPDVIAQKLNQNEFQISIRSVERIISEYGLQKKIHLYRPKTTPIHIETHRSKQKVRMQICDGKSIERDVRQLLANKVSGTMAGIWLLIPEYLRLGTWDLLQSWTGIADEDIAARLALQLVNESALCVSGVRMKRTLSQKGFELSNGLPFVASDSAIHSLLDSHSVADAQRLQIALGKVRQTFGHFNGDFLAIDPHRITSHSKRQMARRQKDIKSSPCKMAQTFFCLDVDTKQPICFTYASSVKTVTQATPELLTLASQILKLNGNRPLVMADNEHYTVELFDWIDSDSSFDMLVPMPYNQSVLKSIHNLPEQAFTRHWAGYATTKNLYHMVGSNGGAYHQFIQRKGELPHDFDFKAFLCNTDRDEIEDLSKNYPNRWHIEEFFKTDQALGWNRAGTMNLNIRYGQMTMALLAQAACSMMRRRIGDPINQWDAQHLAKDFFRGLDGDIRVKNNTIVVTYYNAPNVDLMKKHYEDLPDKLSFEGVKPVIPWLYDFKLDFRFM